MPWSMIPADPRPPMEIVRFTRIPGGKGIRLVLKGNPLLTRETTPAEPSARDLRRELADCIADRDAADGRARFAKDVAARAEEAKCEAHTHRRASEAWHRRGASRRDQEARQSDLQLWGIPPPWPTATPCSNRRANWPPKREPPPKSYSRAAAAVATIADEIMLADARELAGKIVAAIELHWRHIDRLAGLLIIDTRRPKEIGGPRLDDFQADSRRRLTVASAPSPRMRSMPRITTGKASSTIWPPIKREPGLITPPGWPPTRTPVSRSPRNERRDPALDRLGSRSPRRRRRTGRLRVHGAPSQSASTAYRARLHLSPMDGKIHVHAAAVADALRAGFVLVE